MRTGSAETFVAAILGSLARVHPRSDPKRVRPSVRFAVWLARQANALAKKLAKFSMARDDITTALQGSLMRARVSHELPVLRPLRAHVTLNCGARHERKEKLLHGVGHGTERRELAVERRSESGANREVM